MYDDLTKQSVRDALVRNIVPTEQEIKAGIQADRLLRRDIASTSYDIPPSIARKYFDVYEEALRPPARSYYQNDLVKNHLSQNERAAMEAERRRYWR